MKKDLRRMILPLSILLCLSVTPFLATETSGVNPGPFFSINILAPNTNPARNQWATLMVEQLPKIGIEVDVFDHTGWAQISPRTWGYGGPYPIPTYEEGGYDVLFIGNGWGLDFDPTGLFTTDGFTPDGNNFYQYSNPEMDWAIGNYSQAFVFADRMDWAEEIQAILFEDQPSIALCYETNLFPYDEELTGWDPLLWASEYQPMENWKIEGQTDFHYASPADFEDFHPWLYESVYDAEWLLQIFNPLIQRDPDANYAYAPRTCDDFSSSDGLTYTVNINPNAKWADGTALTTDDVIFTYELGVTQSLGHTAYSFNSIYWNNDSITKVSDTEFRIEFLTPYVFQESNLATALLPKHIWESVVPEDHGTTAVDWAKNNPEKFIGTGPYKLESYDPTNQVIHLTRNEYFDDWAGVAPYFENVFFEFYGSKEGALAALASGTVDMLDYNFKVQVDEMEVPGATYALVEDPGNQELAINCLHPWIGTGELCPIAGIESGKAIRRAISHIIPREIICDEILNGLGTPGVTHWPKSSVGFDENLEYDIYDINLALHYMKDAGFDVTPTRVVGAGLGIVIGILALAGAIQVVYMKRRK
ncbi:MAG TPA: ABC transporter substrate-binding protein [candidate division Zixibacteria bacterium]|nr:ABC transporter substrate-binding protein [candidate division Zixibacteria bacterium]